MSVRTGTSVTRPAGAFLRVRRFAGPREATATFVLVHGLGVSSRYFRPLARVLADHGDVLLVDLPGFAGLPRPRRPLGIAGFAAVVARGLLDAGVADCVVIGQSMGSQVATELLVTRPDLVRGAVLVGPTVDAAARGVWPQLVRFARTVPREPARMRAIAVRAYVACGPRWYLQVLPAMIRYPIEERLARVTAPVTLLRGEHDAVSPAAWLRHLAARTGDADARTVRGSAHSVVLERTAEVADAALDVLARGPSR
ncbi:alpha/beta fold hydrolase [Georgenia alba]|uniref:Alpha/beta fold hydrolase n=1 Tax=Georgenia alba TaxID=2233858 RepID=A0ABW2QE07_9MICO